MINVLGRSVRTCQGRTRRYILQAGGAGLLGLSLPRLLEAESVQPIQRVRAKSVIFMFLFGGPSQLETFDMKPDAPSDIRGPFRPIESRTPGLRICEHLARTANLSDKFAVIRTMTHDFNDHSGGGHYIQTGRRWQIPIGGGFNVTPNDWPAIGSVVNWFDRQLPESAARELPSYVVVPNHLGRVQEYKVPLRRPGETAGWLGSSFDPLNTRIDKRDAKDNPYWRDCSDEELQFQIEGMQLRNGLTLDRLNGRRTLLDQINDELQKSDRRGRMASLNRFRQQALNLVGSERARQAFDVRREPGALRDRYGRHLFGQSTLVARRLIEAGVRFVTVHYDAPDGYSWDSHVNSSDVEKHLLPTFDQALAALLSDLDERGMLDETLVVAMGEMGRTPLPNKQWGRNHWSTLFPTVLAGGGIKGGLLHGESDKQAGYAVSHPVSPEDLAATIFYALGIDPSSHIPDSQGRPQLVVDGGEPVLQLFA